MRTSNEIEIGLETCLKCSHIGQIYKDFFGDLTDAVNESTGPQSLKSNNKSVIYKWRYACEHVKSERVDKSFPVSMLYFKMISTFDGEGISLKSRERYIENAYGVSFENLKHCHLANLLKPLFDI